jgi:hypothetical protein
MNQRVNTLIGQLTTMSQQLKVVGAEGAPILAGYNSAVTPYCPKGSFIVGLRIGVDKNSNPYGDIRCAKVQPAIP